MIGKLQGVIDYIGPDWVILMVGGVGYKVYTPEIFTLKTPVALWIETVVREDSIRLFGFSTVAAQNLFNQLTTVSGVGPKVAMAIMSTIKTETLMTAIATGDAKTIATAPGVGKKVAEKIIVELKAISKLVNAKKAQVINYLHGTKLPVGLLVNFGESSLKWERLTLLKNDKKE